MAQWLSALVALAEDSDFTPRTYMVATIIPNFSSSGSNVLHRHHIHKLHTQMYTGKTFTHMKQNKIIKQSYPLCLFSIACMCMGIELPTRKWVAY